LSLCGGRRKKLKRGKGRARSSRNIGEIFTNTPTCTKAQILGEPRISGGKSFEVGRGVVGENAEKIRYKWRSRLSIFQEKRRVPKRKLQKRKRGLRHEKRKSSGKEGGLE